MKITSEAAERNKLPILQVLQTVLPPDADVLEIASGTGQHVIYFASNMPTVTFKPTELDASLIENINAAVKMFELPNVNSAEYVDVTYPPETWLSGKIKPESIDCVLNINMSHISGFNCTEGYLYLI